MATTVEREGVDGVCSGEGERRWSLDNRIGVREGWTVWLRVSRFVYIFEG